MEPLDTPIIAALPVGEFDNELVKGEFDAILQSVGHSHARVIIASPVSDVEGARQSVQRLQKENPDLLMIIALRGLSAETIEAAVMESSMPCLLLPVQGRFALASSALAVGAVRDSKIAVELVYAPPGHPEFIRRIGHVVRAAKAYSQIRKSRIGIIGDLFPNLVSCRYDAQIISSRLGVTFLPISFKEMRSSVQNIAGQNPAIEKFRQEITKSYNIDSAEGIVLDAGIKLHFAMKQVAQDLKLDGFAAECWSGFPKELGLNPCLGFIEDAYSLACEGDVMLCVALLIVRHLTARSAYVGDLFDLDLDGIVTLTHCGAPASLASDKKEVRLAKSQLALERGFETMTCRPRLDRGPVTVFRFYGKECDKLHLASGELLSCEQSPTLSVKVRINANRWDFLGQCFGNHYLVAAGDIRSELKLLCKWLGVTVLET